MATVFIENIDGSLLDNFKSFAAQQGLRFSIFDKRVENQTANQVAKADDNIYDALLNMPKNDDGEDIFAREGSQYSEHRDIDWTV